MACLYKRKGRYWIAYRVGGRRIQKSLRTTNAGIAREKKRKIEYELAVGDLQMASKLPLPAILEAFCSYLETTTTRKSYKNEVIRLRARGAGFSEEVQGDVEPTKHSVNPENKPL